jgi:hypothetical protein
MANEPTPEQLQLQAALQSPAHKIYANGFMMGQSPTDMLVVLLHNGTPTSILNLSYIAAKSLSIELANNITRFEKATGQVIPTAHEVNEKISKVD